MNFNIKCVQNMYKLIFIVIGTVLISSCSTVDPETEKAFTEEFPNLYEAVYQRNGDLILEFTSSSDSLVRLHAWRSLIQSPVEDLDQLIQKVMQSNSEEAWASLWFKELNEKHIEYFENLWEESPRFREGLLVLFSEVGNRSTFELLIDENKIDDPEFDYKLAYATGARSRTIELTTEEEIKLLDHALSTKDGKITQAYLYGYYRARKQFSEEGEDHALLLWADYYPSSEEGNQSIARILSKNNLDVVLYHFPIENYQRMNVQLAVEIAQAIRENEPTDYSQIILNALLDHRNPNVQIAALQAIQSHPDKAENLFRDIMNKIALIDYREPLARMEAFYTILNPARYEEDILAVAADNPSLQTLKFKILEKFYEPYDFIDALFSDYSNEDRLIKFYAIQKLANWWPEQKDEFKSSQKERVQTVVLEVAGQSDPSMSFILTPLLLDPMVFGDDEYQVFENLLSNFSLPEDVEIYQSISQVLYTRFEEEAQSLIDSLAMQGNQALNRSLIQQGWDILQGDYYPEEFRKPDWSRVAKLTANPYVVIETTKGEIILLLDVGKAPVTIAGMDSLMEAGAYQNTPFHRVISNFVIQGGDVETGAGFGGPGYVVPTEASSTMYNRGVVGIASAGRDTEGSQFFIMHQWKPHLNGRYSVIGEVVDGMDVVDRIVQGDVIERMYWY